jgi:hypothetical protein
MTTKTAKKPRQKPAGAPEGCPDSQPTPPVAPAQPSAQGDPAPEPAGKPVATPKAWELRAKLKALAEQGVNGEKTAAQGRLARLEARYDFSGQDLSTPDLFRGVFHRSAIAAPVHTFMPVDYDIANAVKWAIEGAARVPCLYRGGQLCAEAAPDSARRLQGIADTITRSFGELWGKFQAAPGVHPADRANFMLGLFEGMMGEVRSNTALPRRAAPTKIKGRKAAKPGTAPGLSIHPYSVAANLGKQIRFCAPLADLAGELERTIKGEIQP